MCGRFSFAPKAKIIEKHFGITVDTEIFQPRYNCAPSQQLAVISNTEPGRLSYFRWGLIPFWAKDPRIGAKMINARIETVAEKPAYRDAYRKRRCLVPADGFYEWAKGANRQAYRFIINDGGVFAMAGIWDIWQHAGGESIRSFSILTTSANAMVAPVHQRMPVILEKKRYSDWLSGESIITTDDPGLRYPADEMTRYPLSSAVNSPANDCREIMERYPEKGLNDLS